MKISEILRLVWINLIQNKFKVILTSIGIVVGAATIVMVIAIGRGGQMDIEEQFKNLNAGAVDISYEMADSNFSDMLNKVRSADGKGFQNFGGGKPERNFSGKGAPSGDMPGGMEEKKIILSQEDVEDIETFLPGIADITISYNTKSDVEGGDLEEAESYTIAGVKSNYAEMSNLSMAAGEFLTEVDETEKEKVCILGSGVAKEIFGSIEEAYDSTLYIDGRAYIVNGILQEMGMVSSGISPDEAVFIPYSTGIKYIVGTDVSPTITVIMEKVDEIEQAKKNIQTILSESYSNAKFTMSDAGSKMEAASASNDTLMALLISMAVIVFLVGGIGIMNVLFVSVKERTKEIGILKAIGCKKKDILLEFLLEACLISVFGGIAGVLLSFGITPVVEYFSVRVELSVLGAALAVTFAVITGTVFGFYPAWKASKLVPVKALNEE